MDRNKTPLLRVEGLSKSFEGNVVLDQVDFELNAGETHILFGENGAGKSTFTKILCGGLRPNTGEIFVEGEKATIAMPAHAGELGIVAVHQDFSLVPLMSVVENLYLGREISKSGILNKKSMIEEARDHIDSWHLGFGIDLQEKVANLSMEQQQIVAIIKALLQPLKILILDEPTSNFTERETSIFFSKIENLKKKNLGIIYISHVVEELQAIGDRVTILRDGKMVGKINTNAEITRENLLKGMIGRKREKTFPELNTRFGDVTLEVKSLTTASGLQDIELSLRKGEILGIGGLPDSGKSIMGRTLFGLEEITSGSIKIRGESIEHQLSPQKALDHGMVYFPAEKLDGLVLCRSIKENKTLPSLRSRFSSKGFLQDRLEKQAVQKQMDILGIKPNDLNKRTLYLSGGNQQKVIIGRGMLLGAQIFIFDEVTRGVDIASKIEFYKLINNVARESDGVIYISSEISELLDLCNKVIILYNKNVQGVLNSREATREKLVHHILGLKMEE